MNPKAAPTAADIETLRQLRETLSCGMWANAVRTSTHYGEFGQRKRYMHIELTEDQRNAFLAGLRACVGDEPSAARTELDDSTDRIRIDIERVMAEGRTFSANLTDDYESIEVEYP